MIKQCPFFDNLQSKPQQLYKALQTLNNHIFQIEAQTKSFENRTINLFKAGKGKTKVLLWSQMHGNEPISTQALCDVMFHLNNNLSQITETILSELTLYIIPMLNPDGAEKNIRRNAQNIDINRDAKAQTSPEAKFLMQTVKKIKNGFAFNLHDQDRYYGTSNSSIPTTISFLAPAFNSQRTINRNRLNAILLLSGTITFLKQKYPKINIAKYNDNFMETAFGDNIQKKGFSTVLFEAGYIINDNLRQKTRQIYAEALLNALFSIANKNYLKANPQSYFDTPFNIKLNFVDYLLKNINIKQNGKTYKTDIALTHNILDKEKFTDNCSNFIIWDIGDLKNYKAFKTIDCQNITINTKKYSLKRLKKADFLLKLCK